jgi:branched-subunit amino acid aminotransferase/4-amino-4-deoxychorismate lyase
LALKNNIVVEERDVTVQELFSADEAFLTASFKEVVPVVKVDDKLIGVDGKVGPVTNRILELFKGFTVEY